MCFFPCLKVSIFHLVSIALLLLLNVVLISHTNLSQSWVSVSLSSSLNFFQEYMLVIPPLRQARIAVILLFILVTLLLLKNNQISFHQSSNFVLSLSNHPRFGTMLLGNSTCLFCIFFGASAINISSVYSIVFSEMSSVIFNNPSLFNNASILYSQY